MAGHDKKGRVASPPFVQLHRWFLDSPAWRSLSVYSRCLYVEIKRRYNGFNNGAISMSHREAQALLGCSNKPVLAAFRELQERGFLRCEQRGAFKGVPLATTWVLTEEGQDAPVKHLIATKDFMKWQPEKKAPYADGTPTARRGHTAKGSAARRGHTDSVPTAHREGEKQPVRSVPRACTSNLPDAKGATAARGAPANQKAGAARAGRTIDHDPNERGPQQLADIVIDLDFWRTVKERAARVEIDGDAA